MERKEFKITREARVQEGEVILKFYIDKYPAYLKVIEDENSIKIAPELSSSIVSYVTNGMINTPKEGVAIEIIPLKGGKIKPYWGWVKFPTSCGRDLVKKISRAVARKIEELIEEAQEEAQRLGLQGWLWKKAEWDGTRWRPSQDKDC